MGRPSDDMPDEERFEPDYDADGKSPGEEEERKGTSFGEAVDLHSVKPSEEEQAMADKIGEALSGLFGVPVKPQYMGSITVHPGQVEQTLEPAGPLTAEQDARVAALYHARAILEEKEASPGFGRGGGVRLPSMGHLVILSEYILTGNPMPPKVGEGL